MQRKRSVNCAVVFMRTTPAWWCKVAIISPSPNERDNRSHFPVHSVGGSAQDIPSLMEDLERVEDRFCVTVAH